MIANILLLIGVLVVFSYSLMNIPNISDRRLIGDIKTIPLFFGTVMYAMEGIALVQFVLVVS